MSASKYDQFISLCLQARCGEALKVAKSLQVSSLAPKKRRTLQEFIHRFAQEKTLKKGRKPLSRLIHIYENYWSEVLLNPTKQQAAEKTLGRKLRNWLKTERNVELKTQSLEKIVVRLKTEIEKMGFYCITGTVSPLQELEIWKIQTERTYTVHLPEGREKVKTIVMSDFVTKGWMAYATMGLFYPGGWAKKNALYCNAHAYNLNSEKFKVSYLGHEAQHYSDYKKYPKLAQADLEYRAKLTEFVLARKTAKRMFTVFAGRADYNKKSPHAFSYHCVLRDLTKELFGHEDFRAVAANSKILRIPQLNAAARALLERHSVLLKERGARRVRHAIR